MRNLILENYKFPPGLSKSTHDIELVEKMDYVYGFIQ